MERSIFRICKKYKANGVKDDNKETAIMRLWTIQPESF